MKKHDDGTYEIGSGKDYTSGLMFNLYDSFISGEDRVVKIAIPESQDVNEMHLQFECQSELAASLAGNMEVQLDVSVNGHLKGNVQPQIVAAGKATSFSMSIPVTDCTKQTNEVSIAVRIYYEVDYGRRDMDSDYCSRLRSSGSMLKGIRIAELSSASSGCLTFGSYVNEDGIPQKERDARFDEFWTVSKYSRSISYQSVLESSVKNTTSSGLRNMNNYSSGDMFGDLFLTKSMLDPAYSMNVEARRFDRNSVKWLDMDSDAGEIVLRLTARNYINLISCSN